MATLAVRNPRTGEMDYQVNVPEAKELSAICARLRAGQPAWHEQGLGGRIEALQRWRQSLDDSRAELTSALETDTGRGRESEMEIDIVGRSIDRWCTVAPALLAEDERRPSSAIPPIQLVSDSLPYQLAGVISPWNIPLLLSMIDTIPALLAGCAVVVKPSEVTPRFIQPFSKTIAASPLSEVLTFVAGDGATGAAIVDQVDVLAFTGSVATGRKVAEAAARRFIPAFLELGGKDPAVVLESADLERATSACLWGSVVNAGQNCLAIERIYVAAAIYDEFVDRLLERATRLRLAHPTPKSGEIGPIIAERQAQVIADHLSDAVDKGAKVLCGGEIEEIGGGLWCKPTVLTNVDHGMKLMTEETFGPLMPVMPFSSVDEALSLANDTTYGLSAAVFAGGEQEALDVGRRIRAGAVSINDAALTALVQEAEKNSFNYSGLGGSRMGASALRRFTRRKAFLIQTSSDPDPWWFDEGRSS